MKFMKFGKALLISALAAGVALSITSCVKSYAVRLFVRNGQRDGFLFNHE